MTSLIARGEALIGEEVWRVARGFAAGVSVVTAGTRETAHGSTVSAFSVISREPPIATLALRRGSLLLRLIRAEGTFVINVLAAGQADLARHFSGRRPTGETQFDGVPLASARDGVPVLADTFCWLRCQPTRQLAAGDHELVLGEVTAWCRGGASQPLLCLAESLRAADNSAKEKH
jgi:flavin reductase (DIM6/NTAB) family NADH-FMN oxidoreductase RutF